ncbi:MAG: hypothetical protein U1F71_25260 [Verrucomicrobiaceae bacterium]
MSEDSKNNQRFLKWSRVSWLGLFLSFTALCYGMMAAGAGHGSSTPWFFGLVISFMTWLSMLASVILGFRGLKQGVWLPALILQTVVFLVLTCVGIWGMGG